jgi:hypothetical protein
MRTALIAFAFAGFLTAAPAADLFAGTWNGIAAQSKNNWGQKPIERMMRRTYTPGKNGGYHVTGQGIDGVNTTRQAAGNVDLRITRSTAQIVKLLGATHVRNHRANERTLIATYSKDGKPVGTTTSTVSADGHTLTITVEGTGTDGKELNGTNVYEKH